MPGTSLGFLWNRHLLVTRLVDTEITKSYLWYMETAVRTQTIETPAQAARVTSVARTREVLKRKYDLLRALMARWSRAKTFLERASLRRELDGCRSEIEELEHFLDFGSF